AALAHGRFHLDKDKSAFFKPRQALPLKSGGCSTFCAALAACLWLLRLPGPSLTPHCCVRAAACACLDRFSRRTCRVRAPALTDSPALSATCQRPCPAHAQLSRESSYCVHACPAGAMRLSVATNNYNRKRGTSALQ
ncbi:hypothetical protein HAX54_006906, partial [Datura stramonium]|nr:hypothetical protein [Datura stramonium]